MIVNLTHVHLFVKYLRCRRLPGWRLAHNLTYDSLLPFTDLWFSGIKETSSFTVSGQWMTSSFKRTSVHCAPLWWQTMRRRWKCPSMSLLWERGSLRSRHVPCILAKTWSDSLAFKLFCDSCLVLFHLQEYVEYYGGPGVQHIAMNTSDIITAVSTKNNFLWCFCFCKCTQKAADVKTCITFQTVDSKPERTRDGVHVCARHLLRPAEGESKTVKGQNLRGPRRSTGQDRGPSQNVVFLSG